MTNEEVRLRALLSIRTGDKKYLKGIPSHQQFAGLYPEIHGQVDTKVLGELKIKLDNEKN